MGSGLILTHAGSLLLLSVFSPDIIGSHIYLLPYTGFESSIKPICRLDMHKFSFAKGGSGEFLGTDVVVFGLQLFSLQELSFGILNYLGFEKLIGRSKVNRGDWL